MTCITHFPEEKTSLILQLQLNLSNGLFLGLNGLMWPFKLKVFFCKVYSTSRFPASMDSGLTLNPWSSLHIWGFWRLPSLSKMNQRAGGRQEGVKSPVLH